MSISVSYKMTLPRSLEHSIFQLIKMFFSCLSFFKSLLFSCRHHDLLDHQGIYADMWQQQLRAEQGDEQDNKQ